MKVYGLTVDQVARSIEHMSWLYDRNVIVNRIEDASNSAGPRVNITLRVEDSSGPGAKRSHSGRKTVAACWHAYRDVIQALFVRGASRIQTALADYKDYRTFKEIYPDTYNTEAGSPMNPAKYGTLCDCEK